MVCTQNLAEEDPERHQGGKDPIQPAAQRRQRLGNQFFREDVGERQRAILQKLAPEETRLGAKGAWVRIRHPWASLPGMEWLATSILASEALFAYLIFELRLVENYVPFVDGTDVDWPTWVAC